MKKSTARLLPLAGLITLSCGQEKQIKPEQPNIVMIMFDDLGWSDLGIHGNPIIETPHLDSLAEQSLQFSDFYVNPVCAASRASLLTGRHFLRTGVSHVHGGKDFMHLDETTLASVLQENGYKTGIWGKWHSGDSHRYYPWQRGFDEAYKARLYQHRNSLGLFNGQPVESQKWADEVIVDYAIDFVDRNKHTPFFAYVSLLTPHTPLDAPDSIIRKYKNKGLSDNMAELYAMIDFSDQNLGRFFTTLREFNLLENTVIMVFSDNGPAVNRGIISDEDREIRYVNDLRGHKGDIWENGIRSPFFLNWTGTLQPARVNNLFDITDLFPTVLDLAHITYKPELPLDGISMYPFLTGENSDLEKQSSYNYANKAWPPSLEPYDPDGKYNEYQPVNKSNKKVDQQVISFRTPGYKFLLNPGVDGVFNTKDSLWLSDIRQDRQEQHNLIKKKAETADIMRQSIDNWYTEILNEPHSYAPPVLYLPEDSLLNVKATWVSNLSEGLLNTVTAVKKWENLTSGWVEYDIVAPVADQYTFQLNYTDSGAEKNMICTIEGEDMEVTFKAEGQKEHVSPPIQMKEGLNTIRISFENEDGLSITELISITVKHSVSAL